MDWKKFAGQSLLNGLMPGAPGISSLLGTAFGGSRAAAPSQAQGRTIASSQIGTQAVYNGRGGMDYFINGRPVTNAQFASATGQDVNRLERDAAVRGQLVQGDLVAGGENGTPLDGSAGAYDPNLDPAAISAGRAQLLQRLAQARDAFNAIFTDLNNSAAEQTGKVNTGYQQAYDTATNSYQTGLGQLGAAMASRGLGDSSFLSAAQQQSKDAYTQDVNNLQGTRDNQLSSIGQWLSGQQQAYQNQLNNINQIDPNSLGTVNDINTYNNQLGGVNDSLSQARSGLRSSADYQKLVGGLSPIKQVTSDQLAKQLATLTQSSSPRFAKDQIAQGIIKQSAPNQQSYWTDYYQKLLSGTQQVGV